MANRTATFSGRLSGDITPLAPASREVLALFTSCQGGDLDVPDTTAASTSYSVPFGSITEATHCEVRNDTGQDVAVRVGGASVTGTLVSGTATIAFAAAPGERLSVERVAGNGGTNGKLYVERSSGNVIVTSYYASGVQTADVSSVKVYNNAPPLLADGGVMLVSSPAAGSGVASAEAILTDTQAGAGTIETLVFGDPV